MTTVQKIQAATYAISKRLKGYHLLKNPSGTNPLEVSMIKTSKEVNKIGDVVNIYSRTKKTFGQGDTREAYRSLIVERHYDAKNHRYMDEKSRGFEFNIPYQQALYEKMNTNAVTNRPKLRKSEYVELVCRHSVEPDKQNFFSVLFQNLNNK